MGNTVDATYVSGKNYWRRFWPDATNTKPFIAARYPSAGSVNNSALTIVKIWIDDDTGINLSSVIITINGDVAYTSSAFVAPFNGSGSSVSTFNYGYVFTIDYSGCYSDTVIVAAYAEDDETRSVNESWSFSIMSDPLEITNLTPADKSGTNDNTVNIVFDIIDTDRPVLQDTIDAYVEGAWAYDGVSNTFRSPYNGAASAISAITDGYRITIDNTSTWSDGYIDAYVHAFSCTDSVEIRWGFIVDTTAPTLSITYPLDSAVLGADFDMQFDILDAYAIQTSTIDVSIDGTDAIIDGEFQSGWDGASSSITVGVGGVSVVIDKESDYSGGRYGIVVVAKDAYNNEMTDSSWNFYVDTIAPTITNRSPADGGFGDATQTFQFDVTDAYGVHQDTIDVSMDGTDIIINGSYQSGYTGTISGITDGYRVTFTKTGGWPESDDVTIRIIAEDSYGNEVDDSNWDVYIDVESPYVTNVYPQKYRTVNLNLISFDVVDNNGVLQDTIDAYVDGYWAYKGSTNVFKSPFNGPSSSITATSVGDDDGYHIVLDRVGDYPENIINVRVLAEDPSGNAMDTSWRWTHTESLFVQTYGANGMEGYNGIIGVWEDITFGSTTKTPDIWYVGYDADASGWDAYNERGTSLALVGSGDAPSYNHGAPMTGSIFDDAVKFNSGKYYQASDTTTGDIGNVDFVFECVCDFKEPFSSTTILGKGSSGLGWRLKGRSTASAFTFQVYGASSWVNLYGAAEQDGWQHVMVIADTSGSIYLYVNGVLKDTADMTGIGSLSGSEIFTVGANTDTSVAHIAVWTGENWVVPGEIADVVSDRFDAITCNYADYATGSANGTVDRNSESVAVAQDHSDKFISATVRQLFLVSTDWPRPCIRKDEAGNLVYGILVEKQVDNEIAYSEDVSETARWSHTRCSIAEGTVTNPRGESYCQYIKEDGTAASTHYIESTNLGATLRGRHVLSIFAQKSNRDWIRLYVTGTDVLDVSHTFYADFDLTNGVVGTESGCTGHIEDWGNSWFRCAIAYDTGANLQPYTARFYVGEGDNDVTFSGGNQNSIIVFGAQLEKSELNYPTSYIRAIGSTTQTRRADQASFSATGGNTYDGYGNDYITVFLENFNIREERGFFYLGSTYPTELSAYVNTDEHASAYVATGSIATNDAYDISDGYAHEIEIAFDATTIQVNVDGYDGTPAASWDTAGDQNKIRVGRSEITGGTQRWFGGLICKVEIDD